MIVDSWESESESDSGSERRAYCLSSSGDFDSDFRRNIALRSRKEKGIQDLRMFGIVVAGYIEIGTIFEPVPRVSDRLGELPHKKGQMIYEDQSGFKARDGLYKSGQIVRWSLMCDYFD